MATPFSVPTLPSLIGVHGRTRPDAPALVDGDIVITWGAFDRLTNRVANGLATAGVRPGTHVGLLSLGSAWAYTVYFGILRAGAVVTPLSMMWTGEMLVRLASDAGLTTVFVGSGFEKLAAHAQAALPTLEVVPEVALDDLFADGLDTPAGITCTTSDPYSVMYSSGTTGTPKGIVHSHEARLWMAAELASRFDVNADSRTVVTVPPFSNGSNLCLLPAVYAGGTVVLMRAFSLDDLFDIVERERPTHVFMVPTQFQGVVEHERAAALDWSCFRAFITAGAPMPSALRRRVNQLSGERLFELWGLTEGVGTTIDPDEARSHPGSVGRVRPGSDILLIDDDGNQVVDGAGEIVGRTPLLMDGYLNRPEATEAVQWRSPWGELYLRTGDIGELDKDGYLFIRGRAKDMIISGGFNVYPTDIEAVLLEHPAVADAAVFGLPHEKWGETPVGYIVPSDPETGVDVEAVLVAVNERLATPQRLRRLLVHEGDFPRNALGKVLKDELRSAFGRETGEGASS